MLCVTAAWGCGDSKSWADISAISLFRSVTFEQTGDGSTLTDTGAFFTADLGATVADEYSSVSMTPGAGSPVTLTPYDSLTYSYQTALLSSQAEMDSDFPTGTYDFDADSGTDTTSVDYAEDAYP
jgi:hypothetical protein